MTIPAKLKPFHPIPKGVISFTFSVEKLNKNENGILSPEIVICNVPWKIKVLKHSMERADQSENVLGVLLVCLPKFEDLNKPWSTAAAGQIRLISPKTPLILDLLKTKFNHNKSTNGFPNIISWNKIMDRENKFVNNNEVIVEGEIYSNPMKIFMKSIPRLVRSDCAIGISHNFIIEKISEFKKISSDEMDLSNHPYQMVLRHLRWKFSVEKECDHLSLSIECIDNMLIDLNWHYKFFWKFSILPTVLPFFSLPAYLASPRANPLFVCKKWELKVNRNNYIFGTKTLIKWSDLIDPKNGFVENETVKLCVTFILHEPSPDWDIDNNYPSI